MASNKKSHRSKKEKAKANEEKATDTTNRNQLEIPKRDGMESGASKTPRKNAGSGQEEDTAKKKRHHKHHSLKESDSFSAEERSAKSGEERSKRHSRETQGFPDLIGDYPTTPVVVNVYLPNEKHACRFDPKQKLRELLEKVCEANDDVSLDKYIARDVKGNRLDLDKTMGELDIHQVVLRSLRKEHHKKKELESLQEENKIKSTTQPSQSKEADFAKLGQQLKEHQQIIAQTQAQLKDKSDAEKNLTKEKEEIIKKTQEVEKKYKEEIDKLQREIKNFQEQSEAHKLAFQQLENKSKQQLEDREEKCQKLEGKVTDILVSKQENEQNFQAAQKVAQEKFNTEITLRDQKIEKLQTKINEFEKQIKDQEQSKHLGLAEKEQNYEERLKTKDAEIKRLEEELENTQKAQRDIKEKLENDLRQKDEKSKQELAAKDTLLIEYKNTIKSNKTKLDQLEQQHQQQIKELKEQLSAKENAMSKQTEELELSKKDGSATKQLIETKQAQSDIGVDEQLTSYEEELKKKSEIIAKLEAEIKTLKQMEGVFKEEKEKLKIESSQLQLNESEKDKLLRDKDKEKATLEKRITQLELEAKEYKEKEEKNRKEIATLQSGLDQAQVSHRLQLDKAKQELEETKRMLGRDLAKKEEEIAGKDEEMTIIDEEINKLKKQLNKKKETEGEADRAFDELKEKYQTLLKDYQDLDMQYEGYKTTSEQRESAKLKPTMETLDKTKTQLAESETRYTAEINSLNQKLAAYKAEIEQREALEKMIYGINPVDGGLVFADYLIKLGCFEEDIVTHKMQHQFLQRSLVAIERSYLRQDGDALGTSNWFAWTSKLFDRLTDYIPKIAKQSPHLSTNIASNGLYIPFRTTEELDDKDKWPHYEDPIVQFFCTLHSHIIAIYSLLAKSITRQLVDARYDVALLGQSALVLNIKKSDKEKLTTRQQRLSVDMGDQKSKEVRQSMIKVTSILDNHYQILTQSKVPTTEINQLFAQVFYGLNVFLFNRLLKDRELCKAATGYAIKMAVSQLEEWASHKHPNLLPTIRPQFEHLIEASNVLVIDKGILLSESIIKELFAKLDILQINHLVQSFKPDEYAPEEVPQNVIQAVAAFAAKSSSHNAELLDPNKFVDIYN